MRKYRVLAAVMVLSACLATFSYADRRNYVWTYEYSTVPAGVAELEYYLTAKVPDTGSKEASSWQHQFEIEYGLTDDWDIGMYQVWSQDNTAEGSSSFAYDGFKIKSRYKLLKSGSFIVDPLIYIEYIRSSDLAEPDVLEGKLVLTRDIGKFSVSYNAIVESELGGDGEVENEYAAGARYSIRPSLSVGVESTGSYTESEYALGPVISAETSAFWITLGAAFGLNDKTDDVQARLIAGVSF